MTRKIARLRVRRGTPDDRPRATKEFAVPFEDGATVLDG